MITLDLPLFLSFPSLFAYSYPFSPVESPEKQRVIRGERERERDRVMSSTAEEFAGTGGFLYHVPQHSRREKLRFPPDESSPACATSSVPLLYQSNAAFPPSSYYNHHFDECGSYQIPTQGFSLSLSPATVGPLGPFTGYAAVLNRSGFVEPARQLLDDICRFSRGKFTGVGCRDLMEDMAMDSEIERATGSLEEDRWKKLKLLSMLDELYRRYRLYYQQVETVITSFETVAGLNTAAPYVSLALKSMSKNFKSLKNLISVHISNLGKVNGKGLGKGEFTGFGLTTTVDHASSQRRNSSLTFGQPQVWRPQRGLPERAVAVLRAWLFEHFLHPYPTDTDKQMLAKQTGLTRNQVSNWFINARVRLWKPMVEEIHNLEMHQLQKSVSTDHNIQISTFQLPSQLSSSSSSAATSSENNLMQRNNQNRSYPRPSNVELAHMEEPYKFIFDNDFVSHDQPVSMDMGGNSVVSLTLGLPEQLSMNVARRFGLEECSNAYVIGTGFEAGQERHYGKEIGAHLLHDFVG